MSRVPSRNTYARVVFGLLAVVVAAGGCGDDSPDESAGSELSTTTTTAAEPSGSAPTAATTCDLLSPLPSALFEDALFVDMVSAISSEGNTSTAAAEATQDAHAALEARTQALAVVTTAAELAAGQPVGVDVLLVKGAYENHVGQMEEVVTRIEAGETDVFIPIGADIDSSTAAVALVDYAESCQSGPPTSG